MAFLDDIYVVTSRARAAAAFEVVAGTIKEGTGIHTHMGKLQMWSKSGGAAPDGVVVLDTDNHVVWKGDLDDELNGVVILGTPLGKQAFVEKHASNRVEEEQLLLHELGHLEDIQCAWTLLTWSAVPRSNHIVRVVPPSLSAKYALDHDASIWSAFCKILGATDHQGDLQAKDVATLPGRLGGLGLRSASRSKEPAYLASWIDAIPVIQSKLPLLARRIIACLKGPPLPSGWALSEVQLVRDLLVSQGATETPSWDSVMVGSPPPQVDEDDGCDAGEWVRGWQYYF